MEDIHNMTYVQFGNLVEFISVKLGWDMKLSLGSVAPDAIANMGEDDFPLTYKGNIEQPERVLTLKEAMRINEELNG